MNRNIFNIVSVISIVLFLFWGCSDDSEDSQEKIPSSMVCTEWGASMSAVMDYMSDYEMYSMEDDFICYNGKNDIKTISYQFDEGILQASLVLIPEENMSLEDLEYTFRKYEYLGEKNGLDIYVNETTSTMVTIGKKINGNNTYYSVGYVELNAENE